MKRSLVTMLLLAALVVAPRLVRAGDEGDKKKQEKAWKKLEDKQKAKPEKSEDAPGVGQAEDANPLPKILDLMKEVESRLNDTDTGEYTQDDQKKIVEAMKFEGKARAALDDLIKKIEDGT